MISVVYFERNNRYAISAKGHACYAPKGQDIVCAGFSALVESLSVYLDEHSEDKCWHILENRIDDNGDMNIEVLDESGDLYNMFHLVKEGIENIAEQYPFHINMSYKN